MTERVVVIQRTRADYYWGSLAVWLRNPWAPVQFLAAPAINGVILFLATDDRALSERLLLAAAMAIISLLVIAALLFIVHAVNVRRSLKQPGALEPISYQFAPVGLDARAAGSHGLSAWGNFKTAYETKAYFLIVLIMGLAHVLPKRNMSADEIGHVRAALSAYMPGKAHMLKDAP